MADTLQDLHCGFLPNGWEVRAQHSPVPYGRPPRVNGALAVGFANSPTHCMERVASLLKVIGGDSVSLEKRRQAFMASPTWAFANLHAGDDPTGAGDPSSYYAYLLPPDAAIGPEPEDKGKGFILWNPASKLPPKRVMRTQRAAEAVASKMAAKEPGQVFHVVKIVSTYVVPPGPSPQAVADANRMMGTFLRGVATAMALQILLRMATEAGTMANTVTRLTQPAKTWGPLDVTRAFHWAASADVGVQWLSASRHITETEVSALIREVVRQYRMPQPKWMQHRVYRHPYGA
jgi:hypothetical protein